MPTELPYIPIDAKGIYIRGGTPFTCAPTTMSRMFTNAVVSVKKPTTLVLLINDGQESWGQQVRQRSLRTWTIAHCSRLTLTVE